MGWKTRRKDGRHFRTKRTLYGPAKSKKYADIVSIQNPSEARSSVSQLLEDFNGSERAKKVRIKRAVVQAANRAGVASRNERLSERERREMAEVARVYNDAKGRMVIPPKNVKSLSLKPELKDERMAGPDYREKAAEFRKAGMDKEARMLERIAAQEDQHKKTLTEIEAKA